MTEPTFLRHQVENLTLRKLDDGSADLAASYDALITYAVGLLQALEETKRTQKDAD